MSAVWCQECGHGEAIHGPGWCGADDPDDPLCLNKCDCPGFVGDDYEDDAWWEEDDAWWEEDEELTS